MSFVGMGSLGLLGEYPFPNMPFTLVDGTLITDPGSTPATADDCIPYQCGVAPSNMAARQWCSWYGHVGARVCMDPSCAPYRDQLQGCTLPLPPAASPPPPAIAPENIPVLTPANIVQPLPNITATFRPAPVGVPSCSFWCVLNGAISDHPYIALGAIAAIAALAWKRK